MFNQPNEPLAVHSHTHIDISGAVALVKQHMKHQAFELMLMLFHIWNWQNIGLLEYSDIE